MEVTRLNFKEVFPIISKAIKDASFFAIDAEFTGLTSFSRRRENALDTCEERYQKLINGTKDFTIVQFGICAYSWDAEQQQYIAKPFNFYIYPKQYNRQMPDVRFLCQSSSLDFLAGKGFDFNKWIYRGLPFLLPSDEEKLRSMVSKHRDQPTPNGAPSTPNTEEAIKVPPQFEKTIELILKKVEKFIEDPDRKTMSLPSLSPSVHKLVYSSVKAAHEFELYLESKQNEKNEKYIVIRKCSEVEKMKLENEKFSSECDDVEQAVGFSKVIRLLLQSGKLIMGHNMLLDLLHMIRLFVSPLPNDLEGFKALVRGVSSSLVDTKVMASTQPLQEHFKLSHLKEVYSKSSEAPFVKPNVLLPEGFDHCLDSSRAHEAGYDAYITGVAFIAMSSFLRKQRNGSTPCGEMDFEVIKPFLGKVFLFPRMEGIPYLNLNGEDVSSNRDHVFYIQHPEQWHYTDVQKLFQDIGYVSVTKVDGTSSFASLKKHEQAAKVMQKLDKEDVPYRILSYKAYHDGDDGGDSEDTLDGEHSPNHTPDLETPVKTLEATSSKRSLADIFADIEEGEPRDSPEPAKKKLKDEHVWFEEPDERMVAF